MPRARDPAREKAREMWEASGRTLKLREIAETLHVPEKTISGWKSKDGWNKENERSTPKNKRSTPKRSTPKSATPTVDQQLAAAVEENEELTPQQQDFCLYYSRIKNATQSYLKAYGCSYKTAMTEGCRLLVNPKVKDELRRLRDIKTAALGDLCGEDVIELHMRIAFADITDFVEFKTMRVPLKHRGEAAMIENPKTGKMVPLTEPANVVKLKDSAQADGQLISEVSDGREGAKIKLVDRQRSLAFLERYFELNPIDKHRKDYDAKRLDLELLRLEIAQQMQPGETETPESNFLEAMMDSAADVWSEDNNSVDTSDDKK